MSPEMSSVLTGWGPLGVFAILLIYAVYKLSGTVNEATQTTIKAMQVTIDRESARADSERTRSDRLEEHMRDLNSSIHETLSSLAASNQQQGGMLETSMKREQR